MSLPLLIESVRPMVRYVDPSQAVIDTVVATQHPGEYDATLVVELAGSNGFHDECIVGLPARSSQKTVRLELVHPDLWWPACMGEQPLYELSVKLMAGEACVDEHTTTLGLTSIRPDIAAVTEAEPHLLVNGKICGIHSLVTVDRSQEQQLLPATGDSILLVRDHYGPDLLYQAADRAGIMMIQCVPIHAEASPEFDVQTEVERLASHPSLAGWFVGHLGKIADAVAEHIAKADPTHAVFRNLPSAA